MTRRKIKWIVLAAGVGVFAILAAYQFRGGRDFSTDIAELRTQFDADRGKPRLVMLLAPT